MVNPFEEYRDDCYFYSKNRDDNRATCLHEWILGYCPCSPDCPHFITERDELNRRKFGIS